MIYEVGLKFTQSDTTYVEAESEEEARKIVGEALRLHGDAIARLSPELWDSTNEVETVVPFTPSKDEEETVSAIVRDVAEQARGEGTYDIREDEDGV